MERDDSPEAFWKAAKERWDDAGVPIRDQVVMMIELLTFMKCIVESLEGHPDARQYD